MDTDLQLDLVTQLRTLSPLDRAVLVLRHLEDLSVRETADALGVSEQVVRTRSLRALKKLRERMAPDDPGLAATASTPDLGRPAALHTSRTGR